MQPLVRRPSRLDVHFPLRGDRGVSDGAVRASASTAPTEKIDRGREIDGLRARCEPAHDGGERNNMETKQAALDTNECERKAMTAELDRTLVPLKTSDPDRFKALMTMQATFNRYIDDACWLAEEAMWVDFKSGSRDDGTLRSYAWLGCHTEYVLERFFFARTLYGNDAAAMVEERARPRQGRTHRA